MGLRSPIPDALPIPPDGAFLVPWRLIPPIFRRDPLEGDPGDSDVPKDVFIRHVPVAITVAVGMGYFGFIGEPLTTAFCGLPTTS